MTVAEEMALGRDKANMGIIRDALADYDANLNEWKKFELWETGRGYTRNLIASDNQNFNVMLLCWAPGEYRYFVFSIQIAVREICIRICYMIHIDSL